MIRNQWRVLSPARRPIVLRYGAAAVLFLLCPSLAQAQQDTTHPLNPEAVQDASPAPAAAQTADRKLEVSSEEASEDSDRSEGESSTNAAALPESEASSPDGEEVVVESGGGLFESGGGLFEASAGDSSGDEDASLGAAAPTFELNGYVRSDVFIGKVPDRARGDIKASYGELALRLRAVSGTHGDAFAEVRGQYGKLGPDNGLRADLREAYVNAYLGPIDLRLGQQIIVWGRADGFNPTNNLTPIDLRVRSPIDDDRRMGNVGARAFVNLEPFRFEGVWMPLYRAVELPAVQMPQYVTLGEPSFPAAEFPEGLGAARLHLLLSSFEASASYLNGYAPLPGLALQDFTVGQTPPSVRISRTAYRHQVLGLDFSTALGETLAIRGEAAYRRPFLPDAVYAPRPDLQYVLGLERSFGALGVIAQYVGHYTLDWQRDEPRNVSPALLSNLALPVSDETYRRITNSIGEAIAAQNQTLFQQTAEVQHLMSVRLEWLALHDTLSLSALGLVNLTTQEWLAYPKITYQIDDRMSTSIGGEIYVGDDGTLLGLVDETLSAGYAELRYSF